MSAAKRENWEAPLNKLLLKLAATTSGLSSIAESLAFAANGGDFNEGAGDFNAGCRLDAIFSHFKTELGDVAGELSRIGTYYDFGGYAADAEGESDEGASPFKSSVVKAVPR